MFLILSGLERLEVTVVHTETSKNHNNPNPCSRSNCLEDANDAYEDVNDGEYDGSSYGWIVGVPGTNMFSIFLRHLDERGNEILPTIAEKKRRVLLRVGDTRKEAFQMSFDRECMFFNRWRARNLSRNGTNSMRNARSERPIHGGAEKE